MRGLILLIAALVLAGCTGPGATPELVTPAGGATPDASPTPASPAPNATHPASPSPSNTGAPVANGTSPSAPSNASTNASAPATWASPDAAKIRPGIQVISSAGQCTSNFVYTSRDNKTAYIGIAAHCVTGSKVGDEVDIGPGVARGTIAYSSWYMTGHSDPGPGGSEAGASCSKEKDASTCNYNDFVLVAIAASDRASVSPSMMHFGGPTALAASGAVQMLDKVLTYGNSGLRGGVDQASWKEGYVADHSDSWTVSVDTVTPGIPGDSGSGVMTGDGKALGIFVTLNGDGSGGVTVLDKAIAWAATHGGPDVQLATAPLLDPGLLPAA